MLNFANCNGCSRVIQTAGSSPLSREHKIFLTEKKSEENNIYTCIVYIPILRPIGIHNETLIFQVKPYFTFYSFRSNNLCEWKTTSGTKTFRLLNINKIFFQKKVLMPMPMDFLTSHSIFGIPSTKYFFALIKKFFLQTLVEIIFRYFLEPPGTPLQTKWLHI